MKKRSELEVRFNEDLKTHELLLQFHGDNEFVIIGTKRGSILFRMFLAACGIGIVTICLLGSNSSGGVMNSTFSIGGSLLGLILVGAPFFYFYSGKHFKVLFSRKLRQIIIEKGMGVSGVEKRIDFSNIDYFLYRKIELDDFSGETVNTISYQYTFSVMSNKKPIELFSIVSKDSSPDMFVSDFATFLSQFAHKETRAQV